MAGFAGDDPFGWDFDFEDDGDDYAFGYDPFDDYCGGGDEGEELIGGPVVDDGDGEEFCISGFAFREDDGKGGDDLMGEDHASQPSHEDPILETLGRSFDSDGGFGQFVPHLVSALDTSEEEDELIAGDYRGGGGLELERGAAVEEAADDEDDDDDDGIGLMLGGFSFDPRPVVGGFQTLVDTDEEVTSDDDMGQEGGLMLSGFDLEPPRVFAQVVRPSWMVLGAGAEDTDPGDADMNLLEVLAAAAHVGEAVRQLPASRAAVEGLQEVVLSEEEASHGCAVCKDVIAAGLSVLKLPCKHYFHAECIRPWLAIRNTCPVCRFELPTGDAEYDRRQSRTRTASVEQQGAQVQSGPEQGAS
ncbi:hypothetical protein SEVIR_1G053900v4 [Setaria viridis]|uniref:RING-type domain-containing protein n=2 Tax=Setaria TaxID=4554 RepID=K3YTL6_SETIT|nr:E3 ubiquitin-protein ligase CIP8 [Setaria italica]XP_034597035.1 E3 ubiquitin-protein ligase CIP8-like [Setaria viridis]RCV05095.1 hypothetical protein SETIT_1G054700v2 [Setaria italica]RCV05096.1 hypothetical protein SETIT_1G054700v2 [Setaria italica]TKW37541.1 hypothetical protein SEVIR_1G053900v2 [Setaria viridis]